MYMRMVYQLLNKTEIQSLSFFSKESNILSLIYNIAITHYCFFWKVSHFRMTPAPFARSLSSCRQMSAGPSCSNHSSTCVSNRTRWSTRTSF